MAGTVFRTVKGFPTPRPFLKWVGGKGQLLPELLERIDAAGAFGRYHEPFVGGGALFFELARRGRLGRKKAYLSDNNERLIATYRAVKDDVEGVIRRLKKHKANCSKDYFYRVRGEMPKSVVDQAARIIFLNKTCYNGLFRENKKGEFNTPFGQYKNPQICDEPNLRAASDALSRAKLRVMPFEEIVRHVEAGDLVYFDPPYHPLSKTSSFTAYDRGSFGVEGQHALREVCQALHKLRVNVLVSNSKSDLILDLYGSLKGFRIDTVYASRNVNSKADRRGKIPEVLILNF